MTWQNVLESLVLRVLSSDGGAAVGLSPAVCLLIEGNTVLRGVLAKCVLFDNLVLMGVVTYVRVQRGKGSEFDDIEDISSSKNSTVEH